LSNDGFVAFHYRSYGTFFLQQNRLHNIYKGFTHYKYYRARKPNTELSFFGLREFLQSAYKIRISEHRNSKIGWEI
ncbi:hypothetical protein ACTRT3_10165, partial [Streptococcus pneumoniae]